MVKIKELTSILEEKHDILISKQRCKKILQHFSGKKSISNYISYIVDHVDEDSSDSTEISVDDSKDDGHDVYYIIQLVKRNSGLKLSERVVNHFIEHFGANKSDVAIAEELEYNDCYPELEMVQELVDKQSDELMIRVLSRNTSGLHLKYYIGEQTEEMLDLLKNYSEPYHIYARYVKNQTEKYIVKWLAEDKWIFRDVKIQQTAEMCTLAIQNYGLNISYVHPSLLTERLCITAVRDNHYAFADIPKEFQTPDFWLNLLIEAPFEFSKYICKLPKEHESDNFFRVLFENLFKRYVIKGSNGIDFDGVCSRAKKISEKYQNNVISMLQNMKIKFDKKG